MKSYLNGGTKGKQKKEEEDRPQVVLEGVIRREKGK